MVKVIGGKAYKARLARMTSPEAKRQIGAALFAGGERIEVAAALSITNGAVSGKGHVASLPGEPPNADTHVLDRNIETVQHPTAGGEIRVDVSSNAPYSKPLEFGSSRMQARPFMAPAAQAERQNVTELVKRAVDHIHRGGRVARGD